MAGANCEKGAAGVILIYDEKAVRFPWMAMVGYFSRSQLKLKHDKSQQINMMMLARGF
ncbi:MAG: hypothetical protein GQ544_04320 [Candidatus Aminicenantes bacterium]|nr:hypothetical protein [Candidatus Aminicenantes bacterium]